MQKIELIKSVKEFEIGGQVFVLDLSLEASKERDKVWRGIAKKVESNKTMDVDAVLKLYREGLDVTLGYGSYDKLFDLCGKSLYVLSDLINKLKVEFAKLKQV